MSLREEVSRQLKVLIPTDGWKQKFAELDAAGKIDQKQLAELILILLQHVERLEDGPHSQRPQPHTH